MNELNAPELAEAEPIIRIANTILFYALRDKATRIRIEKFAKGARVFYQIEGKEREQMTIPNYVWPDLWKLFKRRAQAKIIDGHFQGQFEVTMQGESHIVHLEHEVLNPQERITLDLSSI